MHTVVQEDAAVADEDLENNQPSRVRRERCPLLKRAALGKTTDMAASQDWCEHSDGTVTISQFTVTANTKLGTLRLSDERHPVRKMQTQRHCVNCRWKSVNASVEIKIGKTRYCCETCRVPLCFDGTHDCFHQYHNVGCKEYLEYVHDMVNY